MVLGAIKYIVLHHLSGVRSYISQVCLDEWRSITGDSSNICHYTYIFVYCMEFFWDEETGNKPEQQRFCFKKRNRSDIFLTHNILLTRIFKLCVTDVHVQ